MYRRLELATVTAGLVAPRKGDGVPTKTSVLGGGAENAGTLRGVPYEETLLFLAYPASTQKSVGLPLNRVDSTSGYVMAPGEVRRIRQGPIHQMAWKGVLRTTSPCPVVLGSVTARDASIHRA